MAEPLLDLGNIGIVRQSIGGGRRAQRMDTEAVDFGADAGFPAVFDDDVAVDRSWIERPVEAAGAVVFDRAEQRPIEIGAMPGHRQIGLDRALRRGVDRNEADLGALALDAEMHHTLPAVQIFHPEPAELFTANAVIEQGGENGAIADPLERICRRLRAACGPGGRQVPVWCLRCYLRLETTY